MSSNAIINRYLTFGFSYGICRSLYYYDKLNDTTITNDPGLECVKKHRITYPYFALMSMFQGAMSATLWPLFMGTDISNYQKSKWGVRNSRPPYPFDSFEWRDKK